MIDKKDKRVEPKQRKIGTHRTTSSNPSQNRKEEVPSTYPTGVRSTISIKVQDYIDYLTVNF